MKRPNRQEIREKAKKPYSPWWDTLMIWVDTLLDLLDLLKH